MAHRFFDINHHNLFILIFRKKEIVKVIGLTQNEIVERERQSKLIDITKEVLLEVNISAITRSGFAV